MPLIETFFAYDANQTEHRVNVFGITHLSLSGHREIVKDYNLDATGEVLEKMPDNPRKFKIKSTGTVIVDTRGMDD